MLELGLLFLAVVLLRVYAYLQDAIHEFGHVLATLAVGWTPVVVVIGSGNTKPLFRLGELRVQIGTFPFGGGMAAFRRNLQNFRMKFFIVSISRSITSMVWMAILVATYVNLESAGSPGWMSVSAGILAIIELLYLSMVLLPIQEGAPWLGQLYDGRRILAALTGKTTLMERFYLAQASGFVPTLLREGKYAEAKALFQETQSPEKVNTPHYIGHSWILCLRTLDLRDEAIREWEAILDEKNIFERKHEALDALACLPLYQHLPDLLPMAQRAIDAALRLEPNDITLKGTKGALLVEENRLEEGIGILKEVMAQSSSENDRAICSYYLAYATCRKGDLDAAITLYNETLTKHPQCPVAWRIGSRIQRAAIIAANNRGSQTAR